MNKEWIEKNLKEEFEYENVDELNEWFNDRTEPFDLIAIDNGFGDYWEIGLN